MYDISLDWKFKILQNHMSFIVLTNTKIVEVMCDLIKKIMK